MTELGGKSPQFVFADADLAKVADCVAGSLIANAGQARVAGSRLIVQEPVREVLVEMLCARLKKVRPGHTWSGESDFAPIVSEAQASRIDRIVAESRRQGAECLLGGGRIEGLGGAFFEPTLLANIDRGNIAVHEEIFGPVLTVESFGDDEEGVALADHPDYGLATGRALRVMRALQAGTIWINRYSRTLDFILPPGGTRGPASARIWVARRWNSTFAARRCLSISLKTSQPIQPSPELTALQTQDETMQNLIQKVENSALFPEAADVVVIGAGIIGTCAAYEMARAGLTVALVEKGIAGGEQSRRNWGWVRQQNRDLHELSLAQLSLRRWDELGAEIKRDPGFRRSGILFVTRDAADMERWEKWGKGARLQGFTATSSAPSRPMTVHPAARQTGSGVYGRQPMAGQSPPWHPRRSPRVPRKAACCFIRVARPRGLGISAGKVAGVWTEKGLIRTAAVVIAGGAWSSRFCRHHGLSLPVANIQGTASRTFSRQAPIYTPDFALRRRIDGSYTLAVAGYGAMNIAPQNIRYATKFYPMYRAKLAKKLSYRLNSSFWNGPEAGGRWHNDQISPFERIRVLNPAPDMKLARLGITRLRKEYPALAGIDVASAWGGSIDTSPDLVPVISRVEELPGLTLASGFSGHGFGIGPGAGILVKNLVMNQTPIVDLAPYRLSRFSDGSAIRRPEMM